MPERRIATSVLIIGAGGSGLRAAIELAELGVDVLIVSKRPSADAHTALAAGGINAALATIDPADTWQQHAADTLKESYLLAHPPTVRIVTQGAARGIEDLERYGMRFAREADGRISQRFFGAHTYRRTAFAGDYTGLEIQRTLVAQVDALQVLIRTCGQSATAPPSRALTESRIRRSPSMPFTRHDRLRRTSGPSSAGMRRRRSSSERWTGRCHCSSRRT